MGIFSQFKEGFSGVLSITTVRNGKALTKYFPGMCAREGSLVKTTIFSRGSAPVLAPKANWGNHATAGDNLQPRFVDEEIAPTMTTEPVL